MRFLGYYEYTSQQAPIEDLLARHVEFRYLGPPKPGLNRVNAYPVRLLIPLQREGLASEIKYNEIDSLHFGDSL